MKSKTIPAIIIAVALVIFTYLFFFRNKQQKPFNLTGEWKLDSAYATQPRADSTFQMILGFFASPKEKRMIQFNADSTLVEHLSKDTTTTQKYYLRDSVLYVHEGSNYVPYAVTTMTDSLFTFMSKDSVVFILKKK